MFNDVKYPEWWSDTVTVYNKFEDPQTKIIRWFRTVIPGCFWSYAYIQGTAGQSVVRTNQVICRIPKAKNFLPFADWRNIENDRMSKYFTLRTGDIIFNGIVDEEIDEYTKGKRSTDIIQKYKDIYGCVTIQTLTINVGPGRVLEHYHVRGE